MTEQYSKIIIGGGAAGIMAAIFAKQKSPKARVAIIDQSFALGRKILISGAGRCNLTNVNLEKNYLDKYFGNKAIIEGVFKQFGYQEIIIFFNSLGLEVYEEMKSGAGKIFPKNDSAKAVVALLQSKLEQLGVEIIFNTVVNKIKKDKNGFIISANSNQYSAEKVIIAAGGKCYPALGSDGSGYELARAFGHKIIEPVPSGVSLVGKNFLSQALQGTKIEAEIKALVNGKQIVQACGDVLFAQYGLSGMAILLVSRDLSIALNREEAKEVSVILNFLPGKNTEQAKKYLLERFNKNPEQTIEQNLWGIFPIKFVSAILKIAKIGTSVEIGKLRNLEIEKLLDVLINYEVNITGTRGWNEAEFTAGGVATAEVNPKTLESKLMPGLYFCGEVLDIDGEIGGYNLSWAWASGAVAGRQM